MTGKSEFIETCVSLSLLEKKDILKLILSEKVKKLCENQVPNSESNSKVPQNIEILDYCPSIDTFPEYAFSLCSLELEKEDIMKYIIGKEFDKILEEVSTPLLNLNSPSSTIATESLTPPPTKRRRRLTIIPPSSLPNNLALFTYKKDDTVFTLTSMPEIIDRFFKGVSLVLQGIYADPTKKTYVLLVIDNGRYKNVWKSSGKANKLTWFTSHEDPEREEMKKIISSERIDIVRKRNGEYRYMGKSTKIDNVNFEEGSCTILVS